MMEFESIYKILQIDLLKSEPWSRIGTVEIDGIVNHGVSVHYTKENIATRGRSTIHTVVAFETLKRFKELLDKEENAPREPEIIRVCNCSQKEKEKEEKTSPVCNCSQKEEKTSPVCNCSQKEEKVPPVCNCEEASKVTFPENDTNLAVRVIDNLAFYLNTIRDNICKDDNKKESE